MESSEHVAVGNAIQLDLGPGGRVPADSTPLLPPRTIRYGETVALGGDFYGAPDLQPISSSSQPGQTFGAAWWSFEKADSSELDGILSVMQEEQAAIDAARAAGQQPSTAFKKLGDSLSYKWNEITGGAPADQGRLAAIMNPGRYLQLAYVNMDHFGADAVKVYLAGHTLAMQGATQLYGQDLSQPQTRQNLLKCYSVNAFADHFLTDLFAGGHVRTPRRALYDMSLSVKSESGLLARVMHNEDNSDGVWVKNANGETWLVYGDGKELDDVNAENLRRAVAAVQVSADEIAHAATTGQVVQNPAALQLIPNLADFAPKPAPGGQNHAALFWADPKEYVYRRGGGDVPVPSTQWPDVNNYDYSYYWSAVVMSGEALVSQLLPDT